MKPVRISVRAMVEQIIKGGDLYGLGEPDLLSEAANVHRTIQRAGGEAYNAEVSVRISLSGKNLSYIISGRIDGLIKGGQTVLQEIKTVAPDAPFPRMQDNPAYWAQAVCYGHMLCEKEGMDGLVVQLLYVRRKSEETLSFSREMTAQELKDGFFAVADLFIRRCEREYARQLVRDTSIGTLRFPYLSYRRGQREMMRYSYLSIMEGRRTFVQAPTGTGKTVAALFPALHALRSGGAEKIFYLTSRTTVALGVLSLLASMKNGGLRVRAVHINAKDKLCLLERRDCNPMVCPYAKGYYDRIDCAIEQMMGEQDIFAIADIKEAGERFCICPFELSLDLSLGCDVILCDYNYVFDPRAQLRRFFVNGGKYALLIDEAHHLPQRSREMFSAMLEQEVFTDLRRQMGVVSRKTALYKATAEFCRAFKALGQADEAARAKPEEFCAQVETWCEAAQDYPFSGAAYESLLRDAALSAFFFVRIAQSYDERYVTQIIRHQKKAQVQLLCLDASKELKKVYDKCASAFLFSATLTPTLYYKNVCGAQEKDPDALLPSPFPRENLFVCSVPVNVTYAARERSMRQVVCALFGMVTARRGNYIAFFPSYSYMNAAYQAFSRAYPDIPTILQPPELNEGERQAFLAGFDTPTGPGMLVFCVLGGIFSQSVDLPGDRLIGAAVVSVGLPQIGAEVETLKSYYDSCGMDGFAYAMRYPGMCRVMQAAGRVIRTDTDKGIVLLIDARFQNEEYASLLPEHFHPIPIIEPGGVHAALKAFWSHPQP